jgi:hypothetical protein
MPTGPKPLVAFGMLIASGAMVWLAQLGVHTGYVDGLLGPLILVAIGVGFSWTIETMVVNHFGGSP